MDKENKKITDAEEFIATFNFLLFVNSNISEIHFHDGSVARYGYDWLD